ncbi:MAG: hypothetical protein PHE55_18825 [Methylococcaceae bacterium]|nr:hypothetical protein [Methylococcaceae bacterium]
MSIADPILENWYQDAESGRSFRIVAIDTDNDAIEVQYLNGDIGEFDSTTWEDSAFFPIEPPEDWSAPFDDVEVEDLGYSDPDRHGVDLQDATLEGFLEQEELEDQED